ncbi:MAG: DUF4189 domain-containing protein [Caulobacteraceae bacterium]
MARSSTGPRLLAVALAAGLIAVFAPAAAAAASAFAAGVPDDVAGQGLALGEAHNYPTREEAEARALADCRQAPNSTPTARSLCKIVDHFDDRCLGLSMDPKDGTPGWGWSIADASDAAHDGALAMCRASSSADRAPYCIITSTNCDGRGK